MCPGAGAKDPNSAIQGESEGDDADQWPVHRHECSLHVKHNSSCTIPGNTAIWKSHAVFELCSPAMKNPDLSDTSCERVCNSWFTCPHAPARNMPGHAVRLHLLMAWVVRLLWAQVCGASHPSRSGIHAKVSPQHVTCFPAAPGAARSTNPSAGHASPKIEKCNCMRDSEGAADQKCAKIRQDSDAMMKRSRCSGPRGSGDWHLSAVGRSERHPQFPLT